ncbi:peptidase M14 [Pseudidiomarina aestuarii]|uniref:Peptidase M14 n=1 Tax=Pseudidiomarina aestuarii TaxID=624146 RepID=A0A7Z7EUC5_9GAMM|nr:M14 family metallopeptidase [Pseudidiomarina aestuarii]RUO42008.1 peptidase M14 [Pseudidiomarina aestuarii]
MTIRWWLALGLCLPSLASACDFEEVAFSAEFEGGKLSQCEQLGDGHFRLTTVAENYPINPSPWYAFTVVSKTGAREIEIELVAEQSRARYMPKISTDGDTWETVPFTVVDQQFQFSLKISDQPLYVAGQELWTAEDYQQWMTTGARAQRFNTTVIGQSVQGRDIVAMQAVAENNKEWLLVIGRQHPPELTGAIGLLSFVDYLAADADLQNAFYNRYNVLVVPMVNPDGVANGHWRHNAGGKDLNRDWGEFSQPETKAVIDYLNQQLGEDERLAFALDFHSTQQDIFYTLAPESGAQPTDFVTRWLDALKASRLSSFTVRERASYREESHVFTHYIGRTYGVHAVTFEFGDNTPRELVRHIGQQSAHELMLLMKD